MEMEMMEMEMKEMKKVMEIEGNWQRKDYLPLPAIASGCPRLPKKIQQSVQGD